MNRLTFGGLVAVLCLSGCASSDEALADKDRKIQERATENESLARQNADLKSTNLVMQSEIEAKNRELTVKETAPPPLAKPAPEPRTAGAKSSHPVVKPVNMNVSDQDVSVEAR